jgi:uncharacterized UPF0160 family protein
MDEQRLGYGEAAEAYRTSQFERAMAVLTDIMANSVKYRVGAMLALEQVRGSELFEGGRVLFLKNGALPWSTVVRKEMPKVLFVISHNLAEQRYMIHTVPMNTETFDARADLPEAWAGLRDAELGAVIGIATPGSATTAASSPPPSPSRASARWRARPWQKSMRALDRLSVVFLKHLS